MQPKKHILLLEGELHGLHSRADPQRKRPHEALGDGRERRHSLAQIRRQLQVESDGAVKRQALRSTHQVALLDERHQGRKLGRAQVTCQSAIALAD